jgi:hypothetical protein
MVGVEVAFMEGEVYGVYLYFVHVVIGMEFILFDLIYYTNSSSSLS